MPNSVLCELTSWSFQPPGNLVAQNKDLPFLLLHVCDFFFFFLLALLPEKKKIIVSSYCSLLLLLLGAVGFRVHILFYNGFYSHHSGRPWLNCQHGAWLSTAGASEQSP